MLKWIMNKCKYRGVEHISHKFSKCLSMVAQIYQIVWKTKHVQLTNEVQ